MIGATRVLSGRTPVSRYTLARVLYLVRLAGSSAVAAVSMSVSVCTDSGYRAARRMPTKPPIDSPTKLTTGICRCRSSSATSTVRVSMS